MATIMPMGVTITLSFDNGPDAKTTPLVLETLARNDVQAAFFVVGSKVDTTEGRKLVQQVRAAGHVVGNHTWSHRTPLGELDAEAATTELERTHLLLASLGVQERWFRPFGRAGSIGPHLLNAAAVAWLEAHRYGCVLWNAVPGDWHDPEGWLRRGVEDCLSRNASLVVLHDLPTGAMRHLDAFIVELKARGGHFTQAFPRECVLMDQGRATRPLSPFVTNATPPVN